MRPKERRRNESAEGDSWLPAAEADGLDAWSPPSPPVAAEGELELLGPEEGDIVTAEYTALAAPLLPASGHNAGNCVAHAD